MIESFVLVAMASAVVLAVALYYVQGGGDE